MSDFIDRIKHRKIGQWALAYAAAAWLLLQLLALVAQPFAWPDLVMRAAIVVLAVGFFAVVVLAWFHGEKGQQRASGIELLMLAVLCVVAAVGVMLVSKRGEDRPADVGAPTETLVQTAMGAGQVSIAVLPFVNMSADPENAYFADGLTEDVLTNLAKMGSLRVVSRTSIMRYKGSKKSVPDIARELGVAHVLEGSVRRAGNQVRITAQLIRAGQDEHLWADTYDGDVKDIFAVQTTIARAIADALSAKLTTSDVNKAAAGQTAVVGAYELHLRGREIARNASDTTEVNRGITLFRRALELDPKFALAEASLSEAMRRTGKRDSAFAAARRAIKLAPNAAEGYAALAGAYRVGGQFREALVEARTAVELNPTMLPPSMKSVI